MTHFANTIMSIEDEGDFVRIRFGLTGTHGEHRGETRLIVQLVLTPQAYRDLAVQLAMGPPRRLAS